MRILIATDAWRPQVNGVVRTLSAVIAELERRGHVVGLVSPDLFRSIACPTYPEIRLALATRRAVGGRIEDFGPDAIHIATEGPLGLAVRRWCLRQGRPFTSAYHTQFPDYLARRTKLPPALFWRYIRWFHGPAGAVLVSTPTMMRLLDAHGLARTRLWGRGVDLACFRPDAPPHPALAGLERPIQLYVGRIAVEKNVESFLASPHPGAKVVVGEGPARARLMRLHPDALFLGALHGEKLASAYASADVFVFPSRTDTFGLVLIEALACGTPVAAFPVPGPLDLIGEEVGALDPCLAAATARALGRDRSQCTAYGQSFSWTRSADQFEAALIPIRPAAALRPAAGPDPSRSASHRRRGLAAGFASGRHRRQRRGTGRGPPA
ncbi:MAG TPA: glycosyltransferase family 1 protein [Allosphingosinicella sp.]|nr:glycosyltransferase family 1 protein [Allosphingosinicella sp.]